MKKHGGARPTAGRKKEYEDPVRVFVTLERAELASAIAAHPQLTKSRALRQLVLEGLSGLGTGPTKESTRPPENLHPEVEAPAEKPESARRVSFPRLQRIAVSEAVGAGALGSGDTVSDREKRLLAELDIRGSVLDGKDYPYSKELGFRRSLRWDRVEYEKDLSLAQCVALRAAIRRALRRTEDRVELAARSLGSAKKSPQTLAEMKERIRRENGHLRRALTGIPSS